MGRGMLGKGLLGRETLQLREYREVYRRASALLRRKKRKKEKRIPEDCYGCC